MEEEQGVAQWESRFDPISELVFTILSQHTSDLNAFKAYDKLVEAFGSWERVIEGDTEDIAQAIRIGGLSRIKAAAHQGGAAGHPGEVRRVGPSHS